MEGEFAKRRGRDVEVEKVERDSRDEEWRIGECLVRGECSTVWKEKRWI